MADTARETEIKELATYVQERFKKQKDMITLMRQFRSLTHEVQVHKAYKKTAQVVRTPILADMIQRVVAQLTVNYPHWKRGLMGDLPHDQKESSQIERWLAGGHLRMELQARRRVFRNIFDAGIADGMAVSQILWNKQVWEPFPRRFKGKDGEFDDAGYLKKTEKHVKDSPFPFKWKDIDPLHYYYWEAYDGEREVFIIEEVPLRPTAAKFNVRYNKDDGEWVRLRAGEVPPVGSVTSSETATLIQRWRKNDVTYLLNDKEVAHVEHKWGRLCIWDFAGLSTSERLPERAFLPVAFAFAQLVPFLDSLLTMKANIMYLNSWPRGILKLSAARLKAMNSLLPKSQERTAQVTRDIQTLDSLITLEENESFDWAIPATSGADMNQLIQLTSSLIDQAGFSPVLKGQAPTADPNGYLYNQMTTLARLAYDPITDNGSFMLRDQAAFMLYAVDKLAKRPVPVWAEAEGTGDKAIKGWITLSSKEIDGVYDTEPKLEPLLPSNLIMEMRAGLEQVQGGAISMYTHREKFMKLEQPEEEKYRILLEKAEALVDPELIQQAGIEAGLIPPPAPAPTQAEGMPLPGAEGMPSADLGNLGLPVTVGQGLPMEPGQVMPEGTPAPVGPIPGVAPPGLPGGFYGRQAPTGGGNG